MCDNAEHKMKNSRCSDHLLSAYYDYLPSAHRQTAWISCGLHTE